MLPSRVCNHVKAHSKDILLVMLNAIFLKPEVTRDFRFQDVFACFASKMSEFFCATKKSRSMKKRESWQIPTRAAEESGTYLLLSVWPQPFLVRKGASPSV